MTTLSKEKLRGYLEKDIQNLRDWEADSYYYFKGKTSQLNEVIKKLDAGEFDCE